MIPGSGRSPGGGHGNPLQYSCLDNPMERVAWWATVHGVTKSKQLTLSLTLTSSLASNQTNLPLLSPSPLRLQSLDSRALKKGTEPPGMPGTDRTRQKITN